MQEVWDGHESCCHLNEVYQVILWVSLYLHLTSPHAKRTGPKGQCALRALGLLLADGAPTVGGGKTFWWVSRIFLWKQLFHKQPTHRRGDDEPFFTLGLTVHDWGWPKNGQTGQACQRSKVVQKGLLALSVTKYSKRESRKRFSCDLKYGESACSYYNNNKKQLHEKTKFSIEQITWDK